MTTRSHRFPRRLVIFAVALLAPLVEGIAGPGPILNIEALVAKSDLIAIGTVRIHGDIGPTTIETPNRLVAGRLIAGSIEIDQILKGPQTLDTIHFQYTVPDEPIGFRSLGPDSYGVFFLKQRSDSNNAYEFTSPHYPSVVAVRGNRIRAGSPTQMVLDAVERVVISPTTSAQLKREAIYVLAFSKSSAPRTGLRSALQAQDPGIRLSAAAALLQLDDSAGLAVAEATLLRREPDVDAVLVRNIRAAIANGIKSEVAVPVLVRLMESPEAETRRAASVALRHIRSAAVVPTLVRALDDTDFEVRLNAVHGLTEVSGQTELMPSWDAFRSDEEKFITYWKQWATRLSPQFQHPRN
jgi:HEAT repeat protein